MKTHARRRGMVDYDDIDACIAELAPRRIKGMPRVGDRVVMSDHPTAQVYTIVEVAQRSGWCHTYFVASLMYVSEYGKECSAGAVDVSTLLLPSEEQLAHC